MRLLLFAALMLAVNFASAQVGARTYKVLDGNFSPEHMQAFRSGTMLLNYDSMTLSMNLVRSNDQGDLLVTLPIVSIQSDTCGILHITALRDARPSDGDLQVLRIEDASQITCPTFVPYVEQASYLTNYYNRWEGREVNALSTMSVDASELPEAEYLFSAGQFIEGFHGLEVPVSGKLVLSSTSIEMRINKGLNCSLDSNCPADLPIPLVVELPVIEIQVDLCGRHLIAYKETDNRVGGRRMEEVVIDDYTHSECKIVREHMIEISYSEILINSKGVRHEKKAQFSFDLPKGHRLIDVKN